MSVRQNLRLSLEEASRKDGEAHARQSENNNNNGNDQDDKMSRPEAGCKGGKR